MKMLVYKSTGSWYVVKDEHGNAFNARIKGVLKIDGITSTNLVLLLSFKIAVINYFIGRISY